MFGTETSEFLIFGEYLWWILFIYHCWSHCTHILIFLFQVLSHRVPRFTKLPSMSNVVRHSDLYLNSDFSPLWRVIRQGSCSTWIETTKLRWVLVFIVNVTLCSRVARPSPCPPRRRSSTSLQERWVFVIIVIYVSIRSSSWVSGRRPPYS